MRAAAGCWVVAGLLLAGCGEQAQALPEVHVQVGQAKVEAEVADTDAEREHGLMGRQVMAEDQGMLFVWDTADRHIFWMKDTPLPLDMIFIAGGKVVGVKAQAQPYDESNIDVGVDSDSVLEMNGGWAARHHVAVGDAVAVAPR
ncbi:MAG: DUF192 domain-containing protein [Proteobacteria bacterium]|nr:DUF192 domain-containing protein [Pseudomonadota bacterium]